MRKGWRCKERWDGDGDNKYPSHPHVTNVTYLWHNNHELDPESTDVTLRRTAPVVKGISRPRGQFDVSPIASRKEDKR